MNHIEQELINTLTSSTSDSQLTRLRTEVRYLKFEGVIGEAFADELLKQISDCLEGDFP